jgi:phenylalanyl-tRNA synthetase beta chain
VALLLAGNRLERDWREGPARKFDAYDAKAEALAALAVLGVPIQRLRVDPPTQGWWHPHRAGRLMLGKAPLADFGLLHPSVLAAFGVKGPVAAVELFLDALPPRSGKRGRYEPTALQPVIRDFAFVVDESLAADALVRAAASADKALITKVRIFDRFTGSAIGDGKASLAIEVTLQPVASTLTEAEIEAVSQRVIAAAGKLGAVLRS